MKSVFRKNAKQFKSIQVEKALELGTVKKTIKIEPYSGSVKEVLTLSEKLMDTLSDDLVGAYVHGSIASDEVITYSDMDTLVIIKDEVFNNESHLTKVAYRLYQLQTYMFQFDALQHHGWFVLKESMLRSYPMTYFPTVLFEYSRSIMHDSGQTLDLFVKGSKDQNSWDLPFEQLARSLMKKIETRDVHQSIFYLKAFLSEFMLLPSLYLQAKNSEAVFKKFSFELAKKDFEGEDWKIMEKVSQLREDWTYDRSLAQMWLQKQNSYVLRKLARRFAPKVPLNFRKILDEKALIEMEKLINQMKVNLNKC